MRKLMAAVLCVPLIAVPAAPASGQNHNRGYNDRGHHDRFDHGAYQGGRYGDYGHDYHHYPDYNQHQGGIGPGKGALIGAAGGSVLGALFSGSAQGAIVGGAAGAGIGAVLGQKAQDNRDRQYYPY
jgi:Glycine zipper 2TM domain